MGMGGGGGRGRTDSSGEAQVGADGKLLEVLQATKADFAVCCFAFHATQPLLAVGTVSIFPPIIVFVLFWLVLFRYYKSFVFRPTETSFCTE